MISQLGRKILASLMCMASLIVSHPLLSEQPSQLPGSSAVDAQGVRHHWSGRGRNGPPWFHDAIYAPGPQYPYEARTRHVMGSGLFRITLDLSTGSVVKVIMIKSTGSPVLDNSCLSAFRQWRLKPGKWKEIDLPVTFIMDSGPPRLSPSAEPFPPRR
jgi:TonB family protein